MGDKLAPTDLATATTNHDQLGTYPTTTATTTTTQKYLPLPLYLPTQA